MLCCNLEQNSPQISCYIWEDVINNIFVIEDKLFLELENIIIVGDETMYHGGAFQLLLEQHLEYEMSCTL